MVSLSVPDEQVEVYYTLDGSEPSITSTKYERPFRVNTPKTLKYFAYDPISKNRTAVSKQKYDIAKTDWKIVHTTTGNMIEATKLMDEDPDTYWATDKGVTTIQEVVIDLGKTYSLKGFTYGPMQERYPFGIITNYEFYVSTDNRKWDRVVRGEFANIVNSRIEQKIRFKPTWGRYIKLRGIKVAGEDYQTSFGEIGVITKH